jgi:hypothetical protein
MDRLPRFLARHALIGFGIALAFVGALLAFDIGGFRSLAAASPSGWLAAIMLAFSTGVTFASLQMGFAIMLLGRDSDDGGGHRRTVPRAFRLRHSAIPASIAATRRGRRKAE